MEPYVHDAVLDMQIARDDLLVALGDLGPDDWRKYVPYGSRTLHDLLAHLAAADHAWALAAQGLLRGEGGDVAPLTALHAASARKRAIDRGRSQTATQLLDEMQRRRRLLLGLYDLLEPRHLALALPSYGERHNSVRERIWLGYHDRLHAADVRRAMRMLWHPQRLKYLPEIVPAVEVLAPDAMLHVIYNIDPMYWERASAVPGWTYRQLLMHIATGDWVLQLHVHHLIDHGSVAAWPDIAAGNAARLEERAHSTSQALTEEFLSMRHESMRLLSQLKPKHLAQTIEFSWESQPNSHPVLEYLLGFSQHDETHREQLRRAMQYATTRGGA